MQPEHYDFTNPVFLPVTLQTCQGLLDAQDHSALDALGDAQLAAVLVIQNLVEAKGQVLDPAAAEKYWPGCWPGRSMFAIPLGWGC